MIEDRGIGLTETLIDNAEAEAGWDAVLMAQADTGSDSTGTPSSDTTATGGAPGISVIVPDADNRVTLAASASIEEIKLDGDDLLLVQPDGSQIRIIGGALNVPTFIIGDIELPQEVLVAALNTNGFNVAAGPGNTLSVLPQAPTGSGGQFSDSSGASIDGDGLDALGLLGDTSLSDGGGEGGDLQDEGNIASVFTGGVATGALAESVDNPGGVDADPVAATGTIFFFDPDFGETRTADVSGRAVVSQALKGGGSLTAVQLDALLAGFSLDTPGGITVESTTAAGGSIAWTYAVANPAVDFLAAGDVITLSFNVQINDGIFSIIQTVTITITGTNDAPVIDTAQPVLTALAEAVDADPLTNLPAQLQTLVATGSLAVTDVDVSEVLTGTATGAATAIWTPNGSAAADASADPRFAGLIAQTALTFDATAVSNGAQQTLNYTYTVTDADINFLGAGDTVVITFPIQVADDAGGIDTATVTVTLTGTNDAPVLEASTGQVTETANTTLSFAANSVSSSMAFTDVDLSDVGHTATIVGVTRGGESDGLPSGILGMLYLRSLLSLDSVTKAAGSSDGQVNWTFSAPDALFDYLSHGQTASLTYTVRVSDGDGGTSTNTVTVTIVGTNDQPRFLAGAIRLGYENTNQTGSADMESFSGTLLFIDPDRDDAGHTASVTGLNATGVTAGLDQAVLLGAVQITGVSSAVNQVAGTVSWSFAAADSLFDYLAAGERVTLAYQVTLDDNIGQANSTDTTTIYITIIGTNDRPVIAADPANIEIAEQAGFYGSIVDIGASGQIAFTDVDLTDGHTASASFQGAVWSAGLGIPPATLAGIQSALTADVNAATVDGDGNIDWVFSLQDQYADFLAPGETLIVTYEITLADNSGAGNATATRIVTVTITGAEDLPFATGAVINGSVFESELAPGGTEAISGTGDDKNGVGGTDDTIFTGNMMSLVDHGGDLHGHFAVETNALSASLTSLRSGGLPLLFEIDPATNRLTAYAGDENGPIVFTFTVDAASGGFTFDLQGKLDHIGSGNDTQLTLDLSSAVTYHDRDGDPLALLGQLLIAVRDDVPTVSANTMVQLDDDSLATGGTPIIATGTLEHTFGGDGAGQVSWLSNGMSLGNIGLWYQYVSATELIITQDQGGVTVQVVRLTITNQATGAYSIEQLAPVRHPLQGSEDNAAFTVSYQVRDADGDTAIGAITVNVNDDLPAVTANMIVQLDDDSLATGGTPIVATGTLGHDFGGDGAGQVSWMSNGMTLGNNGLWYQYISATELIITQNQDGQTVQVVRLTITNQATGEYSIEQLAPVRHPLQGSEDNAAFTVSYQVRDADGDTAIGTITVNVNDDLPAVTANAMVQLDDDSLATGGTPIVATGTLGHDFGGDGAGQVSWLSNGMSLGNNGLWYQYVSATELIITQDQGGVTVQVVRLTITNPATGEYSIQQLAPMLHPLQGSEDDIAFTVSYQVRDADGDTAIGTVTVNVNDDTPVLLSNVMDMSVDEDGGLPGGNPGPLVGGSDDDFLALTSATGFLLVSWGGDNGNATSGGGIGDRSLTFNGITEGAQVTYNGSALLTSNGAAVYFYLIGSQTLVGSTALSAPASAGDSSVVFTVRLDDAAAGGTGTYQFDLAQPVDHTAGGGENNIYLNFGFTATDGDGDAVDGAFTVSIDDDTPIASNVTAGMGENQAVQIVLTEGVDFSIGADHGGADIALGAATVTGGPVGATLGMPVITFGADHRTITVTPGTAFDALPAGETAILRIPYTVTDGDGDTVTREVTVTITGTNDAPVARLDNGSQDAQFRMTEDDASKLFDVRANDTLDLDAGASNAVTVSGVSFSGVPSGINASDVNVTVTADNQVSVELLGSKWDQMFNGQTGYVVVNYLLHGDNGDFAGNQLLVQVSGRNDAPVLNAAINPSITMVEDAVLPGVGGGTLVSDLVDRVGDGVGLDNVTDDSFVTGIAITGQNTANGTWYFSINNGASWSLITAPTDAHALTLWPDARVFFMPNADYSGTIADGLTIRAWDGSGGANGSYWNTTPNGGTTGYSTDTDTVSITVTPVNDTPVNIVPGAQTVAEDTILVFNQANGNRIQISDVDVGAGGMMVTLTVTNGSISVGGGVFVTQSVSFSGFTLDYINAQLATVQFRGNANFNGEATIRLTTSDLGNTGAGGAQTDIDVITINVTPVNDAPATTPVVLAAIAEDSGPRLITQAELLANASDADGDALTAINLQLLSGNGALVDNLDGTWTYTPALNDDTEASFSYAVTDNIAAPVPATATLDLTPVNDAPVNTVPGAQTVAEDTVLVFNDVNGNRIQISDVDVGPGA